MTQTNDWQPELFMEFEPPAKPPWWARYWRAPQRVIMLRLAYEDVILGAIGALMVVIVGFCLGVERGKHLVVARAESAVDTTTPAASPGGRTLPVPVPAPGPDVSQPLMTPAPRFVPPAASQLPMKTKVAAAPAPDIGARYVVQVASFADRATAEASRDRLAKQGVRASVTAKGRYYVLYAGGFSTYAQATAAAGHLRDSYRDCFIRKLTPDQRG